VTPVLISATLAWRARARRDQEACRQNVLRVFDAALPGGRPRGRGAVGALGAAVVDCAPMLNTNGGFFCSGATSATGGRYFSKGIPAWSREARFWRGWRDGAVTPEGRHYRIVPPVAMVDGRQVMVLVFPELGFMRTNFRKRDGIYARNVRRVVRTVAEFNAAHAGGAFPAARTGGRLRVPGAATVAEALGVDGDEAQAIVARLRAVEAGWGDVRRRLGGLGTCLSHMDLGPSNVVMHEGRGVLMDFGHAGSAPVGADLHTVLRYGGMAEVELLALYAEVFAEKGIALDLEAARLALRVSFAGRYRNLRLKSARDREVFERALEMSERLLGPGRAPPK
jgi:hypothetical protein